MKSDIHEFAMVAARDMVAAEVIEHCLYDRLYTTGNGKVHSLDFFVFPLGPKKTDGETNMYVSRQLPEPQAFWVDNISINAVPYNDALMRTGIVEVIIGSKPYFHYSPVAAPFRTPEGMGCGFGIEPGLGISKGQSFWARIYWPRPIYVRKSVTFQFNLNGWLIRPTQ